MNMKVTLEDESGAVSVAEFYEPGDEADKAIIEIDSHTILMNLAEFKQFIRECCHVLDHVEGKMIKALVNDIGNQR